MRYKLTMQRDSIRGDTEISLYTPVPWTVWWLEGEGGGVLLASFYVKSFMKSSISRGQEYYPILCNFENFFVTLGQTFIYVCVV